MSFKHKLFGFVFNIFKAKEIEDNLVSFIVDGNSSFISNFTYIKEEFKKRGNFNFFLFNKNKLKISDLKKLSKSKYIFLNDNFLAMAYMNFNEKTIITQLWHAPGAFKKFGASVLESEKDLIKKANTKVTYLVNTSKNIIDEYSEAFQIDKSKIKSLGIPRMDYYFKEHGDLRDKFNKKYPMAKGKKIILYAPTFRDDDKYNDVFNYFNINEFNREFGDEYLIILKLHPKLPNVNYENRGFLNLSDYENEQELLLISDILISDYSSIAIEANALNKPVILFTYDFDSYIHERGFYFDFKESDIGVVVNSFDDLIDLIRKNDFKVDNSKFLKSQFDVIDGESSKRIVDLVMR